MTATVRYGTLTLCSSCNARRSSAGKGQRAVPMPAVPPVDVLDWIATAHQQAIEAENHPHRRDHPSTPGRAR